MLNRPIDPIVSQPVLPLDTKLGPVHIAITSAEQGLLVWRDIVGLALIKRDGDILQLGVGDKVLIVLEANATAPVTPNSIGLYHVALHVPQRADMARFILRATEAGLRVSPTDHLVSEAVYAWDADGNGIEMTFETPWRGKVSTSNGPNYAVTTDGKPHSGREPIDMQDLMAELKDDPNPRAHLPLGTRVGHVHVHVNSLDDAMRFYRDVIGFGGLALMRDWGMGDVGLDYAPHSLAFNIWSGAAAQLPEKGTAGLRHFTLRLPDADAMEQLQQRLADAGHPFESGQNALRLNDPFGNAIRIELAQ